jgi:hypothetical protein
VSSFGSLSQLNNAERRSPEVLFLQMRAIHMDV